MVLGSILTLQCSFHLNHRFTSNDNEDSPPDRQCRLQIILQTTVITLYLLSFRHIKTDKGVILIAASSVLPLVSSQ